MPKKLKPLFQKRRWSSDFPPRKTRVDQKHHAISRQEKMAFSTSVGLSWHSPPPPRDCADGRTYGRTDGRSRDYYVTTKISRLDRLPNFLSNGAPLAGFARRLRYKSVKYDRPGECSPEKDCLYVMTLIDVSQRHHKQSFSGLHSPKRSYFTDL